MHIEFVNHASFVLEHGPVRMISDPWLEGTAFDEGWALLAKTRLAYEDFARITHIWFSHEHPDHFSPLSLRNIPEQYRRQITVLFKQSEDGKVADFCRKLGFAKVQELAPRTWISLTDDMQIMNAPFGVDDSWLCVKTPGCTLLNINDCEIETRRHAEPIHKLVGDVDVLFTQFSYAGWAGNVDEPHLRKQRARQKLERVKVQLDTFRPRFVVPFASFVWFCHQENFYMNDGVNRIGDVHQFLARAGAAVPVILYPGDRWQVGEPFDSQRAITAYEQEYERLQDPQGLILSKPVDRDVLVQSGAEYLDKLRRDNSPALLRVLLRPVTFYVTDYQEALQLSLEGGLQPVKTPPGECDVAMTAEALNYCLRHLWGWNTLRINGRLQAPRGAQARFRNFTTFGNLSALNNAGIHVGFNVPFVSFAFRHLTQAVLERLGA